MKGEKMQISNINNTNFKSSFKVNKAQIKLNKIEKDFYNELKNIGIFNTVEENEQIHKYSVNKLKQNIERLFPISKTSADQKKIEKKYGMSIQKVAFKKADDISMKILQYFKDIGSLPLYKIDVVVKKIFEADIEQDKLIQQLKDFDSTLTSEKLTKKQSCTRYNLIKKIQELQDTKFNLTETLNLAKIENERRCKEAGISEAYDFFFKN